MRLQVDLSRGVLVSDEGWLCSLDCHTGVASLELDGRCLRVRPLRWVEKNMLARFSHLGATFLRQQLMRTCLMEAGAEPLTARQEEIVADVALWLSNSGGMEEVAPLESLSLADVTFGVCRAMRLKPSDLDQRDAAEVEMLWMAAQRAEYGGADLDGIPSLEPRAVTESRFGKKWEADDFTRIVIVPDPLIDQTEREAKAASDPVKADSHASTPASEADRVPGAASDSPPVTPEHVQTLDDPSARRRARSSLRAMQRQSLAGRFRVLPTGSAFQEISAKVSGEVTAEAGEARGDISLSSDEHVTEFLTTKGAPPLSSSISGKQKHRRPPPSLDVSHERSTGREESFRSRGHASWTSSSDGMTPTVVSNARVDDDLYESENRQVFAHIRGAAALAPRPRPDSAKMTSDMPALRDPSRRAKGRGLAAHNTLLAGQTPAALPEEEADGVSFIEGPGLEALEWVRPIVLTNRFPGEELAVVEGSDSKIDRDIRDRLFDELCDQLQEAVDQLGID